ncbi:MAG: phage tail sheath subtilisin-like domain-containing protein [Burkholderiales bacterium]|nr:phage tail sheath subtilisin-like domain-containing protein [Nitrosomonas sp.]MCP5275675.1 phage tail sheath subtilisin-like domain-containing protein [Burkholderiales bacterium]
MGQYKTPGVYIVEKNAFPNSVVEVATAVPAFIGYTERADNKGKPLLNKAWRISSMSEFISYFGGAPRSQFEIKNEKPKNDASAEADFSANGTEYFLEHKDQRYFLYHSMLLFFQNGGGACYVISVGKYDEGAIDKSKLDSGIKVLLKEQEPTMVVIPDAMSIKKDSDCIALQQSMLKHCGYVMKNRFAILDIYGGYKDQQDPSGNCIENFRNSLGINFLDFAAAYYPWLNTSIVQANELSFENIANLDELTRLLDEEVDNSQLPDAKKDEIKAQTAKLAAGSDPELHKILNVASPLYGAILQAVRSRLNLLPPSAAMAGIYSMVDNTRGVWKAPANVSLNGVVSPSVEITHDEQEDLNVTTAGKSINAIRSFIGEGTLVWGARTLDGNSLDWRYVNVRRTMIMLEESIKLATKAYVFEPNVSNTWVTIKSMINNFLTSVWKRGGLAGATPDDAFGVFVGLSETMTPQDILDGILRVTVLVALSRPAEFIEITFQQQMQKS